MSDQEVGSPAYGCAASLQKEQHRHQTLSFCKQASKAGECIHVNGQLPIDPLGNCQANTIASCHEC